jgi:hypothetical protein
MPSRDTVYDLAKRTPEELRERVNRTFERWPLLRTIYTDKAVDLLIKVRKRNNNALLLRLTSPDDPENRPFWDEVVRRLDLLGPQHDKLGEAMRNSDRTRFEGWQTELWFATWIKEETGAVVEIEAPVGRSNADFRALTSPELWFEIKSPQAEISARSFDPINDEFRRLIAVMPEKYRIDMDYDAYTPIHVSAVTGLVRDLRDRIAATPNRPLCFDSAGIRFRAFPDDDGPYVGIVVEPNVDIGDAYREIAYDKICEAVKQLPPDQAGIVVIDRSNASWMDDDDVLQACHGWTELVRDGLDATLQQKHGGTFRPGFNTRISAVISYSRTIVRYGRASRRDVLVIHNPDAQIPLEHAVFAFPDVRQTVFRRTATSLSYLIEPKT